MAKKEIDSTLNGSETMDIMQKIEEILKHLKLTGTATIVDRNGHILASEMHGKAIPMTGQISLLKARQSAHTGDRTGATGEKIETGEVTLTLLGIDPNEFVPFAGGCPIVDGEGNILGGAGFSEQTAQTDENIITTAVEAAGFSSKKPKRKEIPLATIQNVLVTGK